jgi:hypothetical protein
MGPRLKKDEENSIRRIDVLSNTLQLYVQMICLPSFLQCMLLENSLQLWNGK